jgi:simple sugar transport system permease protein
MAIVATCLLLLLTNVDPIRAFTSIVMGALGSMTKVGDLVTLWTPLLLVICGLLVSFVAGQWNLGAEGQITAGAIFATGMGRMILTANADAPWILLLAAGSLGGLLWGLLAGYLKLRFGINEIFAGLGLNFVIGAITNYLIFGPWRQPTGGNMSGTESLPPHLWLPVVDTTRFTWVSPFIAFILCILVGLILTKTRWGLILKAVGSNPGSARILGIQVQNVFLSSYAVCGLLAGLAGGIQVAGNYHRLIPGISFGYGFLALLVLLIAGNNLVRAVGVSFLFAVLNAGSARLQIDLSIDSSLGGVIQGILVLSVLFSIGLTEYLKRRQRWISSS